jgi:hypothetical protein
MFDWKKVLRWCKAAGIRAVKTFAQTAIALITVGQAFAEINWGLILSTAGVAAVYSLLTSLAGLPEIKTDDYRPPDIDDEP